MKLILGGGGSDEQTVLSNKYFGTLIDSSKPILYIPLAWNHYDEGYENCKKWLTSEFQNIQHGEIQVVQSAEEILQKNLQDYTAIFIGGGNTYKLLKMLKDSGAFAKLKEYLEKGGIIYGGSAGAIIFSKDINICSYMDKNEVNLQDTSGMNLVFDMHFTCHYGNKNEEKTAKATEHILKMSFDAPVIAIPEEDSLCINSDTVEIVGTRSYYIFNHGEKYLFEPNIKYTSKEFTNITSK